MLFKWKNIVLCSVMLTLLLPSISAAQAQTRLPDGLLRPSEVTQNLQDKRPPLPETSGIELASDSYLEAETTEASRIVQSSEGQIKLSEQNELVDKRTRNSRTFQNSDGTTSTQTVSFPMHYLEGQTWKTINTTIRQDKTNGFTHSMLENQFKVRFNGSSGQAAVSFASDSHAVTYRPLSMLKAVGQAEQDTFTYTEAWTSTDMQYKVENDRLKMELHLKDDKAPLLFSFALGLQGVKPHLNSNGSIDFNDASGKPLFRIPQMWVQDASSSEKRYDRLKVNIRQDGKQSIIDIGLDNKGLYYPIVIDPSSELVFDTLSNGGTHYLYDKANRLSQTISKDGTVDYRYDLKGNLLQRQPSANLLANGGFELYTGTNNISDAWNKISTVSSSINPMSGIQIANTPVSAGKRSHKIAFSGLDNGQYAGINQEIKVVPNKPFILSGMFRVNSLSNAKVKLQVDFRDASNQDAGSNQLEILYSTNGRYLTLSGSGTTPATAAYATIYIYLLTTANNGGGEFYVDMMNLRYDADINLVTNPSFEWATGSNGLADGWEKYFYSVSPDHKVVNSPVSGGVRAHKIADGPLPIDMHTGIRQSVKVNPSQSYTANMRLRAEDLTGSRIRFYMDFQNAQHQYVGSNITDVTTPTNSRYVTISANGTTPATAAYVIIYLLLFSDTNNAVGTVYVDMINFRHDTIPNKIANANFETFSNQKVADGWTEFSLGNNSVFASSAFSWSGLKSQSISGVQMPLGTLSGISQDIKIGPGIGYSLSGKFNIQSLNNSKVQFYIDFYNSQNLLISSSLPAETNSPTGSTWTTLNVTGTTPANTAYAKVNVVLRSTGNYGNALFHVDGIQLQ